MGQTFCFNMEGCSDKCKQGCIEGDSSIAVQGHVHTYQALMSGHEDTTSEVNKQKLQILANTYVRCPEHITMRTDFTYLACCPMRAEFPKAQWWLDAPQKGNDIQVLDSAPTHQQNQKQLSNGHQAGLCSIKSISQNYCDILL